MNQLYSVIYNSSLGIWVVASELAKGKKKAKRSKKLSALTLAGATLGALAALPAAAACSDTQLPLNAGATAGVYECYVSGALEDTDNDGSVDALDNTETASHKNKNQTFSTDTSFSLSNDVQWLPDPDGPKTPLPVSYVPASELYNKGALTVTDNAGNVLSELPTFEDWNFDAMDGQTQISYIKTDGTEGFADVYVVDNLQITEDIDSATHFASQIITAQPTQPFVNLTIATVDNGAKLDLVSNGNKNTDGFAIDWNPGQVKQSSLFVAQDGGTLNQAKDTPIRVVFAYTDGVSNPEEREPSSGTFGPGKVLSGDTLTFEGNNYTIDSKEALIAYNNALIQAIKDNTLASSDYDARFREAFKDGAPQYTYTYDPTHVDYTDYFITPEMAASIGKRAIFEASGSGTVNLNANVAAIGQTQARAYNAWAHDGGTVNNNGAVIIDSSATQNALIESGATFNNTGSLTFNVNTTNWADQVSGTGSTYTNTRSGVISVSSSTTNDSSALHPNRYYSVSRNIATEVLGGASAINQGKYFIGSSEPGNPGTATGVHITNAGAFTNSGEMTIGQNASGNSVTLKGGSAAETLLVDDAYNAVSAYLNDSASPVTIINAESGVIHINSTAKNSAAINIGEDPALTNVSGSQFTPQNVTVDNQGTLNVEGKNSTGLKAAGAFTASHNDLIINTGTINVSGAGSSGIFAASGAEISNDGTVVVTGNDALTNRAYGIRADNATVTLEDESNLIVKGSRTTGLYARTGGSIDVKGGTIDVPTDNSASNQVVFWVSGKNAEGKSSSINFDLPTAYELENNNSTLFRIDQGATYKGNGSNLETVDVNGAGSNGYTIATKGTTFVSGGTTINVHGDGATGINVNSGAGTDGKVQLTADTVINVTGDGATIATVDGNTYNVLGNKTGQSGAKLITEAKLSAASNGGQVAERAIGYRVINKGELVQNGTIDFTDASDTTGVYIDGGTLTNNGTITSNGIGIDVYQTDSNASVVNNASNITAVDGTAAIRLNDKASLSVGGNGTILGQRSADAIRVMSGANLATNNASIAVQGTGSGIHFLNTADSSTGDTFTLSGSGQIQVTGNNAAGMTLEGQDASGNPTLSSANLDTRGGEQLIINVDDAGGNGIVTHTSGYVYSGASVNIHSTAGQSALIVKGTTKEVRQTGNLHSNAARSAVVDLTQLSNPAASLSFINSGTIAPDGGTLAVDASNHSGAVTFQNTGSGNITGTVHLGRSAADVNLNQNSSVANVLLGDNRNIITVENAARLTGSLSAGDGVNTVTLKDTSQTNAITLGHASNSLALSDSAFATTLTSGNGDNSVDLRNTSRVDTLTLGGGANTLAMSDNASLTSLLAGDGNNTASMNGNSHAGTLTLGNGDNTLALHNTSTASHISAGHGNNLITVENSAKISDMLRAGDGQNTVNLKGTSQTRALTLGNGANRVNIDGGTTNGTLISGSGNDAFTLYGVNPHNSVPAQSRGAFTTLDAGAGVDTLHATDASWYVLTDSNNVKNVEKLTISQHSTFEVHNAELTLNSAGADTNLVSVDTDSTYFINDDQASSDYRLTQNVKGNGTIRTDTHGYAFDFDNANYLRDHFNGTLELGNGTLEVFGNNATALTNATLQLDAGGIANLPANQPTQVIGGLRFNSGTLFVHEDFIGSQEDELHSHMQVTDLDVSGNGTVHIVANGFNNDYSPDKHLEDLSRKSLLSQDEGNPLVAVVKATGDVTGNAKNIDLLLTNPQGSPLPGSEDREQDIRQGGETVAIGTYGIGGSTGVRNDGLYAAYLLKEIDILSGKTVNLQTSPGDSDGNALDLAAKLTDAGGVEINAFGDNLSLSNHANDYTGATTVRQGNLVLRDSTVLGQQDSHTRTLALLSDTRVEFGNTTQYIGALNSALNSQLALDSGNLTIDNGGTVAGQLTSAASAAMNVNGGTLNVTGANARYHGATHIAAPATVDIHHVSSLGDGAITLAGVLNVINTAAGDLANAISGSGTANIQHGSDVNLSGNNASFSGAFTVDSNSTLRASSAQHIGDDAASRATTQAAEIHNNGNLYLTHGQPGNWTVNNRIDGSGALHKLGNGTLTLLQNAARYSGETYVTDGALRAGSEGAAVNMATSALNLASGTRFGGYGSVAGNVNNAGTFNAGGLEKTALTHATTYTVNGSFTNAGRINLGSDNVTGSTLNIGGHYVSEGGELHMNTVLNGGFAATDTDQLLIGGSASTGQGGATRVYINNVNGKGAFTQPDAIKIVDVKGHSSNDAFALGRPTVIGVYEYRLNKGRSDNNWYLSSFNPAYPPDENIGEPDLHYVNPEIGAFAANQNALSMFNMTLHDRLGEPQYAESLREDGDYANSVWMRVVGSHQRYNAINNQLALNGHSSVVQLGHDVIHWSDNNAWRARAGIMGGVGNQQMTSKSRRTGSRASGNVDTAYSVGMYGTLYQNDDNPLGTYVDTWALYNWYRNTVSMSGYSDAHYNSHGYALSIETGHTVVFGKDEEKGREWQFLPQAQLTYGRMSSGAAGNDSELNIGKTRSDSLESRLGARLTRVYNLSNERQVQPFTELNWRHEFRENTMTFNEHYSFDNKMPSNRYELKVGVEGKRHNNLNGWANVSYSVGDNAYREPKAMVGIKYQW
ncbi:autotransporter outer membrane beta-barrel domain-containing protein [Enterobacteriaceae bacterium 4M9]|nr:autotransporter outer membrane beta-barrel domain-containing protein [Enterobacteriaceae bacterium 4M9]